MSRPFPRVAADLPAQHVRSLPASDFGSPHNLVIDGRPEQVSAARAFVRQVLGSSHPGAERAALLTSELVTNSVLHSDSRRPGNTITVTLTGITDGIRVEVLDAGGASVPSLARIDDEVTDHGLGLRLVSDLSARWGLPPRWRRSRHLVRGRGGTRACGQLRVNAYVRRGAADGVGA